MFTISHISPRPEGVPALPLLHAGGPRLPIMHTGAGIMQRPRQTWDHYVKLEL